MKYKRFLARVLLVKNMANTLPKHLPFFPFGHRFLHKMQDKAIKIARSLPF